MEPGWLTASMSWSAVDAKLRSQLHLVVLTVDGAADENLVMLGAV